MLRYGDEKSKVLAISVGYPGVVQWLRHGAEVGLWRLCVLEQEDTGKPMELPDADAVVFGAWHPAYCQLLKYYRQVSPNIRATVAWSSSPGEMDQAQIEIAFVIALRKALVTADPFERIDNVGCLHPGLVSLFGEQGFELPAPIALPPFPGSPLWEDKTGVALYAPATLKKNALTQILATRVAQSRIGEKARLYTNLDKYAPALDGLGVDHVLEPWVENIERHRDRLALRRLALCASFSESWCYGAVDALAANTTVLGSPTVSWLPEDWRVRDTNDPRDVEIVLSRLLTNPPSMQPRDFLRGVALRQNRLARDAVKTHVLQ